MMKEMKVGDSVLFYHSNAEPSGVVGLAKVAEAAQPDPTQFDSKSEYFDAKATKQKPRWFCVTVEFEKKFKKTVSLEEIKKNQKLQKMILLHRSRLSVQPVQKNEFDFICQLGGL